MEYLPSTAASMHFLDFCTFSVHAKRGFCSYLSLLWNQSPWPLSPVITLVSVVFLPAFGRNLNAPLLKWHPVWPVACSAAFLIRTHAFGSRDRSHGGAALIRNSTKLQYYHKQMIHLNKYNTGAWEWWLKDGENNTREAERSHTVDDRLSRACHYSLWRLRQENSRQARCRTFAQLRIPNHLY